jgi:hypothetical protein
LQISRSALCIPVFALLLPPLTGTPLRAADHPPRKAAVEPLPEAVKYWVVFRHLSTLEAKAAAAEKRGGDGTPYRSLFRTSAKLTEAQAARLSSVAADCVARVEEKDREALTVLRAARAAAARQAKAKGGIPPGPPAELQRLQRERDELIEQAREDLHRALGDQEFSRFQSFVDEKIAPAIHRQPLSPQGLKAPALPSHSGRPLPPAGSGQALEGGRR